MCLGDSQMQTGHTVCLVLMVRFLLSHLRQGGAQGSQCHAVLPPAVAGKSHKAKPLASCSKEWLFHWAETTSPAALDFPLLKFDTGTFGMTAAAV